MPWSSSLTLSFWVPYVWRTQAKQNNSCLGMARHSDVGTHRGLNIRSLAMYFSASASIFCTLGFVCSHCCLFCFFFLVCLFKVVEQSELTLGYLGLEQDCRQEHAQPRITYISNTPLRCPCCNFLCFLPCLCSFQVWPCWGERKRNAWRSILSSC